MIWFLPHLEPLCLHTLATLSLECSSISSASHIRLTYTHCLSLILNIPWEMISLNHPTRWTMLSSSAMCSYTIPFFPYQEILVLYYSKAICPVKISIPWKHVWIVYHYISNIYHNIWHMWDTQIFMKCQNQSLKCILNTKGWIRYLDRLLIAE